MREVMGALLNGPSSEKRLLRGCERLIAHTPQSALKQRDPAGRAVARPKDNEKMGYRVAIVGATGNVGREMLNILEEVEFPVDEIHAIASRKSKGVEVSFGDKTVKCQDIE
ncbi:hypothetical protein K4A07_17985, partial [Lactiplantibacillus plantarum]|nr:hypothetical protein [Lactiplantibacillus plantarum]